MDRKIILTEEEIQTICKKIGGELTEELKNEEKLPVFLGVMKGALNFMYDLVKNVNRPILMDFIQLSSYCGTSTTGIINLKKNFEVDVKDRTIVVVEDVIDTGISMKYLTNFLKQNYHAKRVILCALFDKTCARKEDITIDYAGYVLKENYFLVGYGLDYNEICRNVPYVYVAEPEDVKNWDEVLKK